MEGSGGITSDHADMGPVEENREAPGSFPEIALP